PLGYTKALVDLAIEKNKEAPAMKAQLASPDTDIFTGFNFGSGNEITMETVNQYLNMLPEAERTTYQTMIASMDEKVVIEMFKSMMGAAGTYDGNMATLGTVDKSDPQTIDIYPKDFASKEKIQSYIKEFNASRTEENKIVYTDYVGLLMSSITTIIDIISYVLIAFVSVSLVVSSIMIGIITYISVLERIREIGILRAMGASKKDISRVFMAETGIIGFISGLFGVVFTLIACIPINVIIHRLTGVPSLNAVLPVWGGFSLVIISIVLTLIAGIIPASMAAKKNPVVALRTE
ncbi:MAG: FtsX-like permease family protein, partial [Lachnospiraceae bacterium]|nr:FtsX-like permease family protein [Lachnospiraceae bacterium]